MRHIDGIFVTNPRQNLLPFLLDDVSGGKKWTTDSILSDFIPSKFIYSRSILLCAFMEGLTLEDTLYSSSNLREGSGLSKILGIMPLEAVQRLLFSKPSITIEDILSAISPIYIEGSDADSDGNEEELILLRDRQERFYHNEFKRYLRERSTPSFL